MAKSAYMRANAAAVLATAVVLVCVTAMPAFAAGRHHVRGYFKSNGTYVQGHWRTNPDGIIWNNYSYPGNYNPNTGQITSGTPQWPISSASGTTNGPQSSDGGVAFMDNRGAVYQALPNGVPGARYDAIYAPRGLASVNGYLSAVSFGRQSALGGGLSLAVLPASGSVRLPLKSALRFGLDAEVLAFDVEPETIGYNSSDFPMHFSEPVQASFIVATPGATARLHLTMPFGGLYVGARAGLALTWVKIGEDIVDRRNEWQIQPLCAAQFVIGARTTLDVAFERHRLLDEDAVALGVGLSWIY